MGAGEVATSRIDIMSAHKISHYNGSWYLAMEVGMGFALLLSIDNRSGGRRTWEWEWELELLVYSLNWSGCSHLTIGVGVCVVMGVVLVFVDGSCGYQYTGMEAPIYGGGPLL